MLDHDLIILNNITSDIRGNDICAFHQEEINPEIYLPQNLLITPVDYNFPQNLNWNVKPSNTAFLFIRNSDFKLLYTKCAMEFITDNNSTPGDSDSHMIFAEQRLISMLAYREKIHIGYLLPEPFSQINKSFIHLWGFKQLLRNNRQIHDNFLRRLLQTYDEELSYFKPTTQLMNDLLK
jgi:hypothetical protein